MPNGKMGADAHRDRRPDGPGCRCRRRPRERYDGSRRCRHRDAEPDPNPSDPHDESDRMARVVHHHSGRDELHRSNLRDELGGDLHSCRASAEPDDQESDGAPNPSTNPTRRCRRRPTNSRTPPEHRGVDEAPMQCAPRRRGAAPRRWAVRSSAEVDRCRSHRSAVPADSVRRRRNEVRRNRLRRRDRRHPYGATCRRS